MWTPCTKREIVSGCHLYIGYIDATTSCHPNNCQPSLPADCRPMTRHGSSTSISVISKIARIFFLMSNWLWLINPYFDWFVLFQYWQTKNYYLLKQIVEIKIYIQTLHPATGITIMPPDSDTSEAIGLITPRFLSRRCAASCRRASFQCTRTHAQFIRVETICDTRG